MDDRHVIVDATGRQAFVAEYVAQLAARLHGPRRRRRRILQEIADGVERAVTDTEIAGADARLVRSRTLASFGSPASVADAFADELQTARARQIASWLLLTGPVVGVAWLVALGVTPWENGLARFVSAVPVAPLVPAVVVLAVVLLVRTGRLTQWIRDLDAMPARRMARLVAVACIVVDGAMIAITTGHPLTAALALAFAASSLRIGACVLAWWSTAPARRA